MSTVKKVYPATVVVTTIKSGAIKVDDMAMSLLSVESEIAKVTVPQTEEGAKTYVRLHVLPEEVVDNGETIDKDQS